MLEEFLEKHHHYFADDFLFLKIDAVTMSNGSSVARRLRGAPGGIPWMAILDADGSTLATSDSPEGNIGFPADSKSIEHFIEMLHVARPGMSAANADAIRAGLLEH